MNCGSGDAVHASPGARSAGRQRPGTGLHQWGLGPPACAALSSSICACLFVRAEPRLSRSEPRTCTWGAPSHYPTVSPRKQPRRWAPSSLGWETVWFVTSSKGEAEHRQRQAGQLVTMTGPGRPRPSGPQPRSQGLSSLRRLCLGVGGRNMWQRLPTPPATRRTTPPASSAPSRPPLDGLPRSS